MNNYFGINQEYDTVNSSMYLDNLKDIKKYVEHQYVQLQQQLQLQHIILENHQ